jgi:uracil-DNA glycosylase
MSQVKTVDENVDLQTLSNLCADVVRCTACAACGVSSLLRDDHFDVPQPGYVGESYSKGGVMFIGQNPGTSPERSREDDTKHAEILLALSHDPSVERFVALRSFLEAFMRTWAITQRYLPLGRFGLELEEIAYVNVARCRTKKNAAPSPRMAERCMTLHLERWLDVLQPRVVVFLGKWAHDAAAVVVERRGITFGFINRDRSLPGAERERNLSTIAALLGDRTGSGLDSVMPNIEPRVAAPITIQIPTTSYRDMASGMELEVYIPMLKSLGFLQVERGKVLKHSKAMPSIYLNRRRDGFVYFTAYVRDSDYYADTSVWRKLAPQQLTDNKLHFITIVPLPGRERYAFEALLRGCA